ncbi:hypothetical protein ACFVMC_00995 [Nocardia sp. NPDC127579]|uniref:hypothetical protein n=1 Tax=Nocardia sp. NPDC127579 TaxID=3345402 RepID=UPI0036294877
MKLETAIVAGMFALGAVAASTGVANAVFIGNYATYEGCVADGNSPLTGGTQWECVPVGDGWDLHTY